MSNDSDDFDELIDVMFDLAQNYEPTDIADAALCMLDALENAFVCLDCGIDTRENREYYMVHDHLWESTGLAEDDGMLCFDCLEGRIGRKLTVFDFTTAPINERHKTNTRFHETHP